MNEETVVHPIAPVFDERSKILILGSFPSVKSREQMFFYGHPQNRFWRILATIFDSKIPSSVKEKRAFLLKNRIALWDVVASCRIVGSADSTITHVSPNDLSLILKNAPIQAIFTNGQTAAALYRRYIFPKTKREAITLPSSSPANATYSLERLICAWQAVRFFD